MWSTELVGVWVQNRNTEEISRTMKVRGLVTTLRVCNEDNLTNRREERQCFETKTDRRYINPFLHVGTIRSHNESPPDKETGCNKGSLMNEPFETTLFPIK